MTSKKKHKVAYFETNEVGRIKLANRRFCRMFGYSEDDVLWHYMGDLFRYPKDWRAIVSPQNYGQLFFEVKMKGRAGRSFKCILQREVHQNVSGQIKFKNRVVKIEDAKHLNQEEISEEKTFLFFTKCLYCTQKLQVKDPAEMRLKMICSLCAEKIYPNLYRSRVIKKIV